MEMRIRQISSLEKVRSCDDFEQEEIHERTVLAGERLSYQICIRSPRTSPEAFFIGASVESELADCVRLYRVRDVLMDQPVTEDDVPEEGYITLQPGLMPDLLVPIEQTDFQMTVRKSQCCIWVKADIPRDMKPGVYTINIRLVFALWRGDPRLICTQKMTVKVLPVAIPEQRLIYTRWFHTDCIAVAHNVDIFSEEHWELIDQYIAAAVDVGVNMILVPIHTPPLDTAMGITRPCVQLVDIEKKKDRYEFSFEKFHRFIGLCKKNGVRYFEMSHMFSQGGGEYAPNIMVTEDGKTDYMFGWHVRADAPEYVDFLKQYISAVRRELEREGIAENTYFHISDEPNMYHRDAYKTASGIVRPLVGESKTFDALSDYSLYEEGLVECPVTGIGHIYDFLEHSVKNQWVYYCGGPQKIYPNSIMAMASYRVRILGFLLYKYNIKGFLHWGFNFYYSSGSMYAIDPYLTNSADRYWPSGDPFIVYPGNRCVYPSLRGEVTYEAVQDMDICFVLEGLVGREKVVAMIDRAAGGELRFDRYPQCREFAENLRAEMEREIHPF